MAKLFSNMEMNRNGYFNNNFQDMDKAWNMDMDMDMNADIGTNIDMDNFNRFVPEN
jgi:hypothetical protein